MDDDYIPWWVPADHPRRNPPMVVAPESVTLGTAAPWLEMPLAEPSTAEREAWPLPTDPLVPADAVAGGTVEEI